VQNIWLEECERDISELRPNSLHIPSYFLVGASNVSIVLYNLLPL